MGDKICFLEVSFPAAKEACFCLYTFNQGSMFQKSSYGQSDLVVIVNWNFVRCQNKQLDRNSNERQILFSFLSCSTLEVTTVVVIFTCVLFLHDLLFLSEMQLCANHFTFMVKYCKSLLSFLPTAQLRNITEGTYDGENVKLLPIPKVDYYLCTF